MPCDATRPRLKYDATPDNSTRGHANTIQTLKERFAEQLPEKIEQIKKLRKSVLSVHHYDHVQY